LQPGQIIACKGVKVGEYGGRSLSSMMGTQVTVDADIPEAHRLREWYHKYSSDHGGSFAGLKANTERSGRGGMGGDGADGGGGAIGPLSVIESRVLVNQLRDDTTGGGRGPTAGNEGAIYITKATLFAIRRDEPNKLWYPACNGVRGGGDGSAGPVDDSKRCNKKLSMEEGEGGQWRCQAGCFNPVPNYRYIAAATLLDHSGQEYVTMFDAEAEAVLKRKANEIQNICARSGGEAAGLPAEADAIFMEALGKEYLFSCKAKMQEASNNREARVQVSVVKVRDIDPAKECKALLNSLKQYAALDAAGGGSAM
jgi:replication factor A1